MALSKEDQDFLYQQKSKSKVIAVVLNLLIPGTGHMYVGKVGAGFGILILAFLLPILMNILSAILVAKEVDNYNRKVKIEMKKDS